MKEQYMKIFSALDTDIICVRKNSILPHFEEVTFHNHDGYEIWLLLNDGANFYVEGQGKALERGDLVLISPYAFHYVDTKIEQNYERVFINIREGFLQKLTSNSVNLSDCFLRASDQALNLLHLNETEIAFFTNLTDQLRENLDTPAYGSDLLVPSLLTQILVFLNRKAAEEVYTPIQNDMPKLVKNCMTFINSHLTEDVSLSEISKYVHHNSDYINRKFKAFTGISIQQFVLIKRITLAQKYLRQGVSPCEACYLTGFHNYSNFSRTFSRHTGLSPKQYQINHRQ